MQQHCFIQNEAMVCVSNVFVIENSKFVWCLCCGRWASDRGSRLFVTITWTGKDILYRVCNGGRCGCETFSHEDFLQVEIPEKWTQEHPYFAITTGVWLKSHTNKDSHLSNWFLITHRTRQHCNTLILCEIFQSGLMTESMWWANDIPKDLRFRWVSDEHVILQ